MSGEKFACSTACHTTHEASYCAAAIGQKAYSMCRSGSLKLPGFPEFEQVVNELKQKANSVPTPEFQVCLPVPGALAIKQNLVDYWLGNDMFAVEMTSLVEAHNKKYNPQGIKRGHAEVEGNLVMNHKALVSSAFCSSTCCFQWKNWITHF